MISKLFAILTCTILLQTSSAFAQTNPANSLGAPGCGDPKTKFEVANTKSHSPAKPNAQKALIYFIEYDSDFSSFPKPTTRLGVDGEWTGAMHGNSYFFVSVDPGVHHLCASWQSTLPAVGRGNQSAAAHFTAEPGGVYYFKVTNRTLHGVGDGPAGVEITLNPLDSDQGQLQANKYKLSTSHPKS